jgi:hypothetical protein
MKVLEEGNTMQVWLVFLGMLLLLWVITGCSMEKSVVQNSPRSSEAYTSIVGPAGPEGPIGPVGAQGAVGATGAPGAGMVGSTGERGLSGQQ